MPTDDFNGTPGQLLSARAGWTLAFTDDCLKVSASGTTLAKPDATATALHFYKRDDDGSTTQSVKMDLAAAGASIVVLGSGTSSADFNGYGLRVQTLSSAVRLYRWTNGAPSASPIISATGLTDLVGMELRVSVSGGNPTLQIFRQGLSVGTPPSYTDVAADKKTSGVRGILVNATGAIANAGDNWADDYTAPASVGLSLTERIAGAPIKPGRSVPWELTYTGSPSSIEARWVDRAGSAISGQEWATVDAAPTGGASSFSFTAPTATGDYRLQIRDGDEIATVTASNFVRVGKVIVHWSQSQGVRLFQQSDDKGALSPTSGIKCTIVYTPAVTNLTTPTFLDLATGHASVASGIIAEANQIWADNGGQAFTLVECGIVGTSITQWLNNEPEGTMTWGVWDYATAIAAAIEYQVDALGFNQGTTDVGLWLTYPGFSQDLADKFDLLYPGENPIFIVHPHLRSDDGEQTWNMRNAQYQKAISGGRWRLGAWQLDHQLTANADPHQKAGVTGNGRIGTRHGRAIAKHLYNTALDTLGPQVSSCRFTDETRNVIELTYNKAIETPAAVTTGLPGFSISTDSGATFGRTGFTAAITASTKVQITKDSGGWVASTTRVDYLRGTPFASDASVSDYVGAEADMETNYLSKVIADTTSFDSGRGMPAAPVMGTGFAVSEFSAIEPEPITDNIGGLNQIAIAVGAEGGHQYNLDALNAISQQLTGSAGHTRNLAALNAIAGFYIGSTQTFTLNIDALNAITGKLGGASNNTRTVDALAGWLGKL